MDNYVKYWKITPKLKIAYDELFEYAKNDLDDWEVRIIWYLRNLPLGTKYTYYVSAKKLYEAYQAKLALTELPD